MLDDRCWMIDAGGTGTGNIAIIGRRVKEETGIGPHRATDARSLKVFDLGLARLFGSLGFLEKSTAKITSDVD